MHSIILFIYTLIKLNIYNVFSCKYNYNNYVDHNYILNTNKYYKLK